MKNRLRLSLATSAVFLFLSTGVFANTLNDGMALYKSGKYHEAVKVLKAVAESEPENPEPHLWLAKCYEQMFQIEDSIKANQLYQKLKYQQGKKPETVRVEQPKQEEAPKQDEQPDNTYKYVLVKVNDDFIINTVAKRNPALEVRNLKYVDLKSINESFDKIPKNSDELQRMYKKYEIKSHYHVANFEEELVLRKTRAAMLDLQIDTTYFEVQQEKDAARKAIKERELKRLFKDYEQVRDDIVKLINTPVQKNNDPLTYDYFLELSVTPEIFKQELEERKPYLKESLERAEKQIDYLKKSVIEDEKELSALSEQLGDELLEKDISELRGSEAENVNKYRTLEEKISSYKNQLFNYMMEEEVLKEALAKIDETTARLGV